MKIEKANKKEPKKDHGVILIGLIPSKKNEKLSSFFLQWFPSKFKAESYSKKKGWEVEP